MKSFLIVAAAALTTAGLSLPATAGTVGCSEGAANASINATQCGLSKQKTMHSSSSKATKAKASAPKKQAKKPQSQYWQGPSDAPRL
jgi:hypothetical protein